MKKKNVFRTAALLAVASVSFAGCSEDDDGVKSSDSSFDGTIQETVQNPPSNEKVDAVKIEMMYNGGSAYAMYEAGTGTYKDGSLELTFLPTLPDYCLYVIAEDMPSSLTVSDDKAKMSGFVSISAYKDGSQVGVFGHGSGKGTSQIKTTFMYVDRDVSITGSDEDYKYNVSLKTGWNKLYEIKGGSKKGYTTTDPGGLTWAFNEYSSGDGDSNFDGTIQATVQNPPSDEIVNAVKAVVESQDVIATGTYQGGSFSLTLPTTGLGGYLRLVKDGFDAPGITVSPADAKMVDCRIRAYQDDRIVGIFEYSSTGGGVNFVYVDKDVNITGSFSQGDASITFNVFAKQGWNKVYMTGSETNGEYTTTEPSGMKWYFDEF